MSEGIPYKQILDEKDKSKGHGYFIEKYGKKAKGRALAKAKKIK